ncbi:MAG: hypothetical protein ACOH2A_13265 [Sphingobacteriaceae bacterium]
MNKRINNFFSIAFTLVTLLALAIQSNGQQTVLKPAFITVKALKSNLAADAIGVNTHLNYSGSVYDTQYEAIIKPRLAELGTKHIRDHFGDQERNERYVELAHQFGIRLLLIHDDAGNDLEKNKQEVKRLNGINKMKPVVDLIEPANERDNGWKSDWFKLCSYMKSFYSMYKADAKTAAVPLLGPSFANTRNSAVEFAKVCTDASSNMDMGNLHAYSGLFPESALAGGWGIGFKQAITSYRAICADKPIIETESGYKMSEGASGHPAVSQRTAAKYSARLVLERMRFGVNQLYFYQLINDAEDFGLLNADGSARLQFTALKNFIHLMADAGGDFSPGTLNYALTGDLQDIRQMLFQKQNGNFMLIIWQGVNGSEGGTNNNDYKDIDHPDRKVTLHLTKKASAINVYRPSFKEMPQGNGQKPVARFKNSAVVELSVPDHILIVEIAGDS